MRSGEKIFKLTLVYIFLSLNYFFVFNCTYISLAAHILVLCACITYIRSVCSNCLLMRVHNQ